MENSLASELLHEIKLESRRRFILLLICIVLLCASNIAWLIAWNLPKEEYTESYELQGEDDANVVYNSQGEVKINGEEGENSYYEDTESTGKQTEKP